MKYLLLLISFFVLSGCAVNRTLYYDKLNNLSKEQEFVQAANVVDKNKKKIYGSKSLLLYYVDKAYFLHLAREYESSNQAFAKAKKLFEQYYTKSVTTGISSFLVNDNMLPYYGKDFEKSLMYIFSCLNYLLMDNEEDALVEVRAVNHFLKTLQANYGSKKVYKEDAFVRYIMALVYDNAGEINDAFISYRKALYVYKTDTRYFDIKPPQVLFDSAIDCARVLGFYDEISALDKDFPSLAKNYKAKDSKLGELVVLHYNGLVPHKISTTLDIAFGKAWAQVNLYESDGKDEEDVENASKVVNSIASDEQLVIAFPKYVKTDYLITASNIEINNDTHNTLLVTSIGNLAVKDFDDHKASLYTKALARSAVKFALVHNVNEKIESEVSSPIAAFLLKGGVRAAAALTEDADKRSWRVLPDDIRMARIRLPEGNYNLDCTYNTNTGLSKTETIEDIEIRKGKKRFIIIQSAM